MTPNHVKILYALNGLFFCALVALSLYTIPKYQQQPHVGQLTNGAPIDASTKAALESVTVGSNTDSPAANKNGAITQINGRVLTVKDTSSGQAYTVSTNSDTKVILVGAQKNPVLYQKEMDAYYAQVKLLMQDPIKNKAALASLTIPDPVELKTGTLADLVVGDTVDAQAAAPIASTSFTAVKIFKAPSVTH